MNDKELFNEISENKEDYLIFINDDIIHADNRIEQKRLVIHFLMKKNWFIFCFISWDLM